MLGQKITGLNGHTYVNLWIRKDWRLKKSSFFYQKRINILIGAFKGCSNPYARNQERHVSLSKHKKTNT